MSSPWFRRRLLPLLRKLGNFEAATQLGIEMKNGSLIQCRPSDPDTNVGDTLDLLVIDEAARTSEELFSELVPALIVSKGRLIALSTPFGKRGWFYEEWVNGEDWERFQATWEDCPRVCKADVERYRRSRGDRKYRQNFCCDFTEMEGAYFSQDEIARAFQNDLDPLFA